MASTKMVPDPQALLTCTICHGSLSDPQQSLICPECSRVSQSQALKSTSVKSKQYYEELRRCKRHQEDQKLFCMKEQIFLCRSCSKSQEHEAHEVCPLEVAAENYRERLQNNLEHLRKNLKDVQKQLFNDKDVLQTWSIVWTEQVDMSREVLLEKFQEICEFLTDEEEDVHSLVALDEEEDEMLQNLKDKELEEKFENIQQRNKIRIQLSLYSDTLREMLTALVKKSQMSDRDLLQDIGDTLNRSESLLLQKPEPFTPKLSDSYCMDLSKFLRKFQDSRLLACHYPYELSDDRKMTFTFADISSGQTYVVYTSGSIHFISGRELSITPLDMESISKEKQAPPMLACYCLPI